MESGHRNPLVALLASRDTKQTVSVSGANVRAKVNVPLEIA